jgi:gentisate 1,2-dioxygenase
VKEAPMTSPGAAEQARPLTEPEPDQDARLAELYAAMAKVNLQALWTQAADLMPGQPAPRAVLSQERQVSHVTAQKALAVLKNEGIIHSVIGKALSSGN